MDGREQLYRWVGPYMVSRQVVAVNADSGIETLADLAGMFCFSRLSLISGELQRMLLMLTALILTRS